MKYVLTLLMCALMITAYGYWRESNKPARTVVLHAPLSTPDGDDDEDNATGKYDIPLTPYKQPVLLLDPAHDWKSEEVMVPDEPDEFPYVCFRVAHRRTVECVYRGYDGQRVDVYWVMPSKDPT